MPKKDNDRPGGLKGIWQGLRETIYGMAAHDMSRARCGPAPRMEHLFILITMGDLLGVPILPPYYSLRLLPYVVPADRHLEAPHAAGEGRVRRDVLAGRQTESGVQTMGMRRVFRKPGPPLHHVRRQGRTRQDDVLGGHRVLAGPQGNRVLVFSVDPQASLTDIFQRDIFGKGPVKIMDNLWAQEIDADSHIKAYQRRSARRSSTCTASTRCPRRSRTTSRRPAPSRPWRRARSSTPWSTSS